MVEALWRAFSIALTVLALNPARAARCAWFHRSRTRAARNRRPFCTGSSGSMVSSWLQQSHHARKHRTCKGAFGADGQGELGRRSTHRDVGKVAISLAREHLKLCGYLIGKELPAAAQDAMSR